MKKKYISPSQKVHVLNAVSHIMQGTTISTGSDITNPDEEVEGEARDNSFGNSGSTNIWDNEW